MEKRERLRDKGKKIQKSKVNRNKTVRPHKKALKGGEVARTLLLLVLEERQEEEKRRSGGTTGEEETKKRSKSCGHGCTKRDSGCTSTCPFLESSAVRILLLRLHLRKVTVEIMRMVQVQSLEKSISALFALELWKRRFFALILSKKENSEWHLEPKTNAPNPPQKEQPAGKISQSTKLAIKKDAKSEREGDVAARISARKHRISQWKRRERRRARRGSLPFGLIGRQWLGPSGCSRGYAHTSTPLTQPVVPGVVALAAASNVLQLFAAVSRSA
ncbi:hypothetical protein WH47_00508 [Habropoda laboriosa]|uniref:Uncharacterized protein n=1 Tax=Habropoda laboriosa TaxID=597456 RepID=A0A0L7R3W2_9HYME|nr:hypothetical protein WH47_00508 [Habropoda laboriosa]